jgi:glycosyltransferase involved in cell wall biosynthesis
MRRILVSLLAFDKGKSGIADYTVSVCRELSRRHKLDLLIHPSDTAIFPFRNDNLTFRLVPEYLKPALLSTLWHLYILPWVMQAKRYDLILLPAGNRRLLARYPQQTVVTFHDLAQYHVPDRYDRWRMFYVKHIVPHYLRRAPHIMAISENTKNDLIKYYYLPPQLITVNYNGFDPEKIRLQVSEQEMRSHYHLDKPYFYYNSRIEHPVKNHLHLIRAFELIPDEIRDNFDLVFTGLDWHGSEVIHEYLEQSPARQNVRFLGEAESKYLGALYHYAYIYVFPSLYEGFGIPLLEAMASGAPVLCSNRSALPEIGGDAVLTFDPEMHADIAAKLIHLIKNPEQRAEMSRRGLQQCRLFSWQRHVQILLALAGISEPEQT